MDNLPLLIKKRYGKLKDFAEEVLEMTYTNFRHHIRHQSFNYKQIKKILDALQIKFEDLIEIPPLNSPMPKPQSTPAEQPEPEEEPTVLSNLSWRGSIADTIESAE